VALLFGVGSRLLLAVRPEIAGLRQCSRARRLLDFGILASIALHFFKSFPSYDVNVRLMPSISMMAKSWASMDRKFSIRTLLTCQLVEGKEHHVLLITAVGVLDNRFDEVVTMREVGCLC
jgi:hypothetical protein